MAIKVTLELKDQEYLQAFVRMMSLHPLFVQLFCTMER